MKWRPQDVVALVLALGFILALAGSVLNEYFGTTITNEVYVQALKDILMVLVGGIVGYIGGKHTE